MSGNAFLPKLILKISKHVERVAAIAQGKDYGSTTISRENKRAEHVLLPPCPLIVTKKLCVGFLVVS